MERVFVGHDWSETDRDIYVEDNEAGGWARPGYLDGVEGFHDLVAVWADELSEVVIAAETDRVCWSGRLVAAGYRVLAVV